jgi:hypothetical protein
MMHDGAWHIFAIVQTAHFCYHLLIGVLLRREAIMEIVSPLAYVPSAAAVGGKRGFASYSLFDGASRRRKTMLCCNNNNNNNR